MLSLTNIFRLFNYSTLDHILLHLFAIKILLIHFRIFGPIYQHFTLLKHKVKFKYGNLESVAEILVRMRFERYWNCKWREEQLYHYGMNHTDSAEITVNLVSLRSVNWGLLRQLKEAQFFSKNQQIVCNSKTRLIFYMIYNLCNQILIPFGKQVLNH